MLPSFNVCLLVPHYEHHQQFSRMLPKLASLDIPVIVVDDGSSSESVAAIRSAIDGLNHVMLYCLERNKGKGHTVMRGFQQAIADGFTHAIQIDADGQHALEDVPKLLGRMRVSPEAVVVGLPVFDESIPAIRYYGRKMTDWWVRLETLSRRIPDSMCGFRGYPLAATNHLIERHFVGPGMDFDVEFLVKADWAQMPLRFVETKVHYPDAGVSHFRYFKDNVVITKMHLRLVLGMLSRCPVIILRNYREFRE